MSLTILLIFTVVGFLFAKILSGKREGESGILPSLKFSCKEYFIHAHHWLLACLLLIILLYFKYYDDRVYGILIGVLIQGLTYRDFYRIIYIKDKR